MWINSRYARMWSAEPWTFKKQIATVTLSSGSNSTSLSTFSRIEAIWDGTDSSSYYGMEALRPEDYHGFATDTSTKPVSFTVIGNTSQFDAPASGNRSLVILGERSFTPLSSGTDVPLIPEEFHLTLAHGAISEGLRLEADPAWQGAEQDFEAGITAMRQVYLTAVRTYSDICPPWP